MRGFFGKGMLYLEQHSVPGPRNIGRVFVMVLDREHGLKGVNHELRHLDLLQTLKPKPP